jgi:Undecaprenyl-phosphate glucose phosphotransferase
MQRGLSPLNFIRLVSDLMMVNLSWLLAYWLRFHSFLDAPKGIPDVLIYVRLMPFVLVIWLGSFTAAGFYRRTGRHRSAFTEALDIIQSCVIATFAFIAFTYFYDEYRYSRVTILFFAVLHPVLIITLRSLIRKLVRYRRRRQPARRTLCIVSPQLFEHAMAVINLDGIAAHKIVACIAMGDGSISHSGEIPVIREPDDWQAYLIREGIQRVVIAVSNEHLQHISSKLDEIANQVPDIQMIPDLFRFTRFSAGIENIRGIPVINVHSSPMDGASVILKRLLDIFGSLVGIILVSPIMLIAAVLVKLSSRGPILYRQERMGLDGRPFMILKFRSMPLDAEKKTGAVWATANDQRPTWIGGLMRKTSIDELPQLFNILRGQMSLVGPRPERPVFVEDFRRQIPGYMLRHKVKAGLTGWAQVNGWRGNTSLEKRIEFDLFYIQNWSIWMDIKIILMTCIRIFFDRNAY